MKVEVGHRQLTVDFVNRVTPTAAEDTSTIRLSDQMEFSNQIGLMNRRFQTVATDAAEKLKRAEMLLLRWNEYQRSVTDLLHWFKEQEQKLQGFQTISHLASIPQALADIQVQLAEFSRHVVPITIIFVYWRKLDVRPHQDR